MNIGEIIPLKEPQLQFSTGRHNLAIDPRFGLATFHSLDCNTGRRDFSSVDIGVLAKEDEIKTVLNLLNRLNNSFEPEGKGSKVGYKGFEKIYEIPINIPEIGENKIISYPLQIDW